MIDIHAHILPGIDDGSSSLEESLEMAGLAYESGVRTIVATPHSNIKGMYENFYSKDWIEHFRYLQHHFKEAETGIRLVKGMEIFASNDVAQKIQEGKLISIHDSRYYLIEFPFDVDPYWMGDVLESVLSLGKVPVIAHPERYYCIQDHPEFLYEWMSQGCRSQMNRGSVFGRFGRHAASTSEVLLEHNLVSCIASDAHSSYRRTTYMADIRSYMEEEYGRRRAEELLVTNPERILNDKKIVQGHMTRPEGRRWF